MYNWEKDYNTINELYSKIYDGLTITFTKDNVEEGDKFLIFNECNTSCTCTFHTKSVPFWVEFDNDEPMCLEDCPMSFYRSILKNIK